MSGGSSRRVDGWVQALGRRPWFAELLLRLRRFRDRLLIRAPFGSGLAAQSPTARDGHPTCRFATHTTNTLWRLPANWFKSW